MVVALPVVFNAVKPQNVLGQQLRMRQAGKYRDLQVVIAGFWRHRTLAVRHISCSQPLNTTDKTGNVTKETLFGRHLQASPGKILNTTAGITADEETVSWSQMCLLFRPHALRHVGFNMASMPL